MRFSARVTRLWSMHCFNTICNMLTSVINNTKRFLKYVKTEMTAYMIELRTFVIFLNLQYVLVDGFWNIICDVCPIKYGCDRFTYCSIVNFSSPIRGITGTNETETETEIVTARIWGRASLLNNQYSISALRWHHNERNGVSNHQLHDCFLNHLFNRWSKKTSKLRVTGLCVGNSTVTSEFHAQRSNNA